MKRESPLAAFGYALTVLGSIFATSNLIRLFTDAFEDKSWLMWSFIVLLLLTLLGVFLVRRDPYVREVGRRNWKLNTPGMSMVGWYAVLSSILMLVADFRDRLRTSGTDGILAFDQFSTWLTVVLGALFLVGIALVIIGERAYTKRQTREKGTSNIQRYEGEEAKLG
jgi:hypothetical protein